MVTTGNIWSYLATIVPVGVLPEDVLEDDGGLLYHVAHPAALVSVRAVMIHGRVHLQNRELVLKLDPLFGSNRGIWLQGAPFSLD